MKSIGVEVNYSSLQKNASALVLETEQESQNQSVVIRESNKSTYISRLYKQVHQFV